MTPSKNKSSKTLDEVQKTSTRVLMRCSSTFPFELRPDIIEVTDQEVVIMYRKFLGPKTEFTIEIDDLMNVRYETNGIFVAITFQVEDYQNPPRKVRFLKKSDATRLKQVVMGLIHCHKQGINTSKYDKQELLTKLIDMGENETMDL